MANNMYIVYTSQGFTQDNGGNVIENLQILEVIDTCTIKKEGIKSLENAADYAKFRMESGAYGCFDSLAVVPAKDECAMRIVK